METQFIHDVSGLKEFVQTTHHLTGSSPPDSYNVGFKLNGGCECEAQVLITGIDVAAAVGLRDMLTAALNLPGTTNPRKRRGTTRAGK
jgi:hypothetical protein